MNTATTNPLGCIGGTLTGASGTLLFKRLSTTASDFSTDLGLVSTKTCIRHLADISLVHQVNIYGGFEKLRG